MMEIFTYAHPWDKHHHHNHYQRYHFEHLRVIFESFFLLFIVIEQEEVDNGLNLYIFSLTRRNVFQLHNVHGCVFSSLNDFNIKLSSS